MDIHQELLSQSDSVTIGIPCTLASPDMTEEIDILGSANCSLINVPQKSSKVYLVNIQGSGTAKSTGSRLSFNNMNVGTIKPINARPLAPKPELCEETGTSNNASLSNSKNNLQLEEVILLPLPPPVPLLANGNGSLLNASFKACSNNETKSLKTHEYQESVSKSMDELAVSIPPSDPVGKSVCTISKIFSVNLPTVIENDSLNIKGKRRITFSSVNFGKTFENVATANMIDAAPHVESMITPPPIVMMENKETDLEIGQKLEPEQPEIVQETPPEILQEPFDPILVSQALMAANRKKRPNIIKSKVQKEKLKDNKIPLLFSKCNPKKNSIESNHPKLETNKKQELSLDLSACLKEAASSFSLKDAQNGSNVVDADEVTLVKINGTSDLEKKVITLPDDDVHIEIIPAKAETVAQIKKPADIDPLKVLDWNAEGVGILPGSDFKFRMNEFGMMELVDNEDNEKDDVKKEIGELVTEDDNLITSIMKVEKEVPSCNEKRIEVSENVENDISRTDSRDTIPLKEEIDVVIKSPVKEEEEIGGKEKDNITSVLDVNASVTSQINLADTNHGNNAILKEDILAKEILPEEKVSPKEKDKLHPTPATDDIFYCRGCGCYGLASEYVTREACSAACDAIVKQKEKEETELRNMTKMRRLKRKLDKGDKDDKQDKSDKSEKATKIAKHVPIPKKEERTEPSDPMNSNSGWQKATPGALRLPWQFGSKGFSWPKYLNFYKTKAAPRKLFKCPLPYSKNNFRIGMKMEGIDPEHSSLFCVLSVKDVIGYRIKLHFDGYPNKYDFWLSADSLDIFPPGWCDKTNRVLQPPKGYTQADFNWTQYLKQTKGSPAAKTLFYNKDVPVVISGGFRIGMKLEAVDRQNTNLVCVATVSDMIGTRILVHFDGWDDVYDYWAEPTSSYIHPVGWCEKHKHPLSPPNNFIGENFNWDLYLKETNSSAAPARAFKPPLGTFRRGMRLECVDKRAPWRVRVATVDDIREHEIRIKFDGWSDMYSYWIDRDSPDIFPMSWCHTTGHFLHIPPVEKDAECPTINCSGQGHVLESEVSKKHTVLDCPYDPDNLKIKIELDDRLTNKSIETNEDGALSRSTSPEDVQESKPKWRSLMPRTPLETSPSPTAELKVSPGRPSKRAKLERSELGVQDADWLPHYDENRERRRKKKALKQAAIAKRNIELDQIREEVHEAVMRPGYNPKEDSINPLLWSKHSAPLNTYVETASKKDLRVWDLELVYRFVASIPGCKPHARYFIDNFIDGEALSMITQQDLIEQVGIKLGPAIKLFNSVVLLREKVANGGNLLR